MEPFSSTKLVMEGSNRNRPSRRQQYIEQYRHSNPKRRSAPEKSLSIYAELSRKDYSSLINGSLELCLPYGVKMENKNGSRGLFFECSDKNARDVLIDGLESSGISWQER